MNKIYHYTDFDTFKKIIETGTFRLNSLTNVDDAEEGFLLDAQSQNSYTFVSCWTKSEMESIPLWTMYVKSDFAVRIGISPNFLKPKIFKRYFIENHTNRNGYVFLMHRGEHRGSEFLSEIIYREAPSVKMLSNIYGMATEDYIKNYGIVKNPSWEFQKEIRFIVQAVQSSSLVWRRNASIYTICQESIFNNDATNIKYIDMKYDVDIMSTAEIMLGPSTSKENEDELRAYLNEYLPGFNGLISRSKSHIRPKTIRLDKT